ncbi:MAG: peptidase, partial [Chthonomonadales bacterium]|nr:peptidase [Chthonomonadales bacterium]
GPMVMLTNQFAGSDGDIVSHCFKLMGLGPLIGTRTWGGVIGIAPHNPLADGTVTTQPEYSFWFKDVGWGVENYGTDPDIEVQVRPQDYAAGHDPQLDKGLEVIAELLEKEPPLRPSFDSRPSRALPRSLPERSR